MRKAYKTHINHKLDNAAQPCPGVKSLDMRSAHQATSISNLFNLKFWNIS